MVLVLGAACSFCAEIAPAKSGRSLGAVHAVTTSRDHTSTPRRRRRDYYLLKVRAYSGYIRLEFVQESRCVGHVLGKYVAARVKYGLPGKRYYKLPETLSYQSTLVQVIAYGLTTPMYNGSILLLRSTDRGLKNHKSALPGFSAKCKLIELSFNKGLVICRRYDSIRWEVRKPRWSSPNLLLFWPQVQFTQVPNPFALEHACAHIQGTFAEFPPYIFGIYFPWLTFCQVPEAVLEYSSASFVTHHRTHYALRAEESPAPTHTPPFPQSLSRLNIARLSTLHIIPCAIT